MPEVVEYCCRHLTLKGMKTTLLLETALRSLLSNICIGKRLKPLNGKTHLLNFRVPQIQANPIVRYWSNSLLSFISAFSQDSCAFRWRCGAGGKGGGMGSHSVLLELLMIGRDGRWAWNGPRPDVWIVSETEFAHLDIFQALRCQFFSQL